MLWLIDSPANGFGEGKGGANTDSRQVSQICKGVSEWCPFSEESVKSAPKQYGIYIFRMAQSKCFKRLKGESDILYIGSTEGEHGLRGRLQQYLHPGPTQWTNKRIHEMAPRNMIWKLLGAYVGKQATLNTNCFIDTLMTMMNFPL